MNVLSAVVLLFVCTYVYVCVSEPRSHLHACVLCLVCRFSVVTILCVCAKLLHSVAFDGVSRAGVSALCVDPSSSPCEYTFAVDATPTITSVAVSDPVSNTGFLFINGTQLTSPLQV